MAVDYTAEVVEELGITLEGSSGAGNLAPEYMKWDCSIGGLDFLYATSNENRFVRKTAQFRRERIDTERTPGEQSLENGLWIRSQASWHYGAGLSSAEPLEVASDEARFRYYQSGGVDPWEPGEVKLLNSASLYYAASATFMQAQGIGTGVLFAEGDGALHYVTNAGVVTSVTRGGTGDLFSLTDTGEVYLVSDAVGIWKGTLPTGTGAKIYNKHYGTPAYSLVRWVKSRLMYAENQGIWEITNLSPSSATLGAAFYEHPNSGWQWTDFAEGPTSIYASGYSNENSAIYRIGVTSTNTTVTLAQPIIVAEMPRGEDILSLYTYVGSFVVIGTTSGVRIGRIESDGSLTVGPLVLYDVQVDDAVGFGSYLYVTVRDKGQAGAGVTRPGIYRINLGQNLNNNALQFAHAPDMITPTAVTGGECRSVTVAGGKLWWAVNGSAAGSGLYRQMDTFVDEGWIETGRIRLGTMEKKAWRDLRMIAPDNLQGTIQGYASVFGTTLPSTWQEILELSAGITDGSGKLNSAAPGTASDFYLAFKLISDPSCGCSARLTGYQLRAVPAPRRTELLQVPLMLFDKEVDSNGSTYGRLGGAFERFEALKAMENTGATVTWRDFTTGESQEVYVEEVTYSRNTPPSKGQNRTGSGGVCTVVLRTV